MFHFNLNHSHILRKCLLSSHTLTHSVYATMSRVSCTYSYTASCWGVVLLCSPYASFSETGIVVWGVASAYVWLWCTSALINRDVLILLIIKHWTTTTVRRRTLSRSDTADTAISAGLLPSSRLQVLAGLVWVGLTVLPGEEPVIVTIRNETIIMGHT